MCSGNNNKEVANIVVAEPSIAKFSSIYELKKIIKLETTEESLFAVPSKIVKTTSYLFILDQTRDGLLAFDNEGKFVKKIGTKGKGPKEYLSITSFTVDEKNNTLIFYDDYKSSLFYYSLDSLSYMEQKKIDFPFRTFESYDSKLVFYRSLLPCKESDLAYDIIITDSQNPRNIEKKDFPYDFYNGTRGHTEKLLKTTNDLFFYKNYSDTIYTYKSDKFIPKYAVRFCNSKIPRASFYRKRNKLNNIKIGRELLKGDYIYSYRFFSTQQHILISYFAQRKHFLYVKDCFSGKDLSVAKLNDDYGFGLDDREPDFFVEDFVGFVIYPYLIDKNREKGKFINKELQELDIEDNPYLMLFSLKNL